MNTISYRRRCLFIRHLFSVKCLLVGFLILILIIIRFKIPQENPYVEKTDTKYRDKTYLKTTITATTTTTTTATTHINNVSAYSYETFIQWNRSLCSIQSDRRGQHQKIISLSIYGTTSKYTDNPMYSWGKSILLFLEPLANEIKLLLPSWIIRVYIDFTGSTKSQRDFFHNFSNIDICDITNLPLFNSSFMTHLPGKMWRFLPIFDPYVDYILSRDLDSPMTRRETETIDMWLSNTYEKDFFYIARDHKEHGVPIPGGLWGAAPTRARQVLYDIFRPMLLTSIARLYTGAGDQEFLLNHVWPKIKEHSLSFDSYYCKNFNSQPFPSQRPAGNCFLGCIRPCCTNTTNDDSSKYVKPCPKECRPKDHQDWTYC